MRQSRKLDFSADNEEASPTSPRSAYPASSSSSSSASPTSPRSAYPASSSSSSSASPASPRSAYPASSSSSSSSTGASPTSRSAYSASSSSSSSSSSSPAYPLHTPYRRSLFDQEELSSLSTIQDKTDFNQHRRKLIKENPPVRSTAAYDDVYEYNRNKYQRYSRVNHEPHSREEDGTFSPLWKQQQAGKRSPTSSSSSSYVKKDISTSPKDYKLAHVNSMADKSTADHESLYTGKETPGRYVALFTGHASPYPFYNNNKSGYEYIDSMTLEQFEDFLAKRMVPAFNSLTAQGINVREKPSRDNRPNPEQRELLLSLIGDVDHILYHLLYRQKYGYKTSVARKIRAFMDSKIPFTNADPSFFARKPFLNDWLRDGNQEAVLFFLRSYGVEWFKVFWDPSKSGKFGKGEGLLLVEELLLQGYSPFSLLELAISQNNYPMLEFIFQVTDRKEETIIDMRNYVGFNPRYFTLIAFAVNEVKIKDVRIIDQLIIRGSDPSVLDKDGLSPLVVAIRKDQNDDVLLHLINTVGIQDMSFENFSNTSVLSEALHHRRSPAIVDVIAANSDLTRHYGSFALVYLFDIQRHWGDQYNGVRFAGDIRSILVQAMDIYVLADQELLGEYLAIVDKHLPK